jgi:dihydrofolate synthase / folylpolyglutamate synthase
LDYEETLAYLYAQLPMFQRIGKAAYKADLSNTHALMEILGHPERGLRCVHVAGTNGKGSTSHMIASILQAAGLKTGLHTSPHLKDMRERFRIGGAMIPQDAVVAFVEEYRDRFEPVKASFFEWGVALALYWFRQEKVDIAVLETGMGGRLDSTNVVMPEVSVITNIGWDHADFLGDSLVKIAGEKAGIIKSGIPVVIGEADAEIAEVFREKARSEKSAITFVDHDPPLPHAIGLHGPHQLKNARTALAAIHQLQVKGWPVDEVHIKAGLANVVPNTGLMGRWQKLSDAPLTYADVAHNPDGIRAICILLKQIPHERLHIVLGTVNDKDLGKMLAELPKEATYYFCKADIPRGLEAERLKELAQAHGLDGTSHGPVAEAYAAAQSRAGRNDLILVTGSVFVVAEVL